MAEILECTQVKQRLDPEGPLHFRVFGLGSEGATKHVCRLQTARARLHCCQLCPNATKILGMTEDKINKLIFFIWVDQLSKNCTIIFM